jgi:hypothetical protein
MRSEDAHSLPEVRCKFPPRGASSHLVKRTGWDLPVTVGDPTNLTKTANRHIVSLNELIIYGGGALPNVNRIHTH